MTTFLARVLQTLRSSCHSHVIAAAT